MRGRWSAIRDLYLTVDRRVLGAVRIATGLVLLYDLVRRFRLIDVLYANTGVLSNHFVLFNPEEMRSSAPRSCRTFAPAPPLAGGSKSR